MPFLQQLQSTNCQTEKKNLPVSNIRSEETMSAKQGAEAPQEDSGICTCIP